MPYHVLQEEGKWMRVTRASTALVLQDVAYAMCSRFTGILTSVQMIQSSNGRVLYKKTSSLRASPSTFQRTEARGTFSEAPEGMRRTDEYASLSMRNQSRGKIMEFCPPLCRSMSTGLERQACAVFGNSQYPVSRPNLHPRKRPFHRQQGAPR